MNTIKKMSVKERTFFIYILVSICTVNPMSMAM